jgi:hypothetical protein
MAGATFAQALGILVFVIILLLLAELLWVYILSPVGRMLRDQGVIGLARGVYSKFFEPILYGKDKSPRR